MSVYFIRNGNYIKIGVSVDPWKRLSSLQTGNPEPLEMLAIMPGSQDVESALHRSFGKHMKRGEWFETNTPLLAFIDIIKQTFPDLQKPFTTEEIDETILAFGPEDDRPQEPPKSLPAIQPKDGGYKSYRDDSPLLMGESITFRMTHKGHFRNPCMTPAYMWSRLSTWIEGYWEHWESPGWNFICAPGLRFDFLDAQNISIMRYADAPHAPAAPGWGVTLRYSLERQLNDALKEAVYNRKNNGTFLGVYNEEYGITIAVRTEPGEGMLPLDVSEDVISYWRQYRHKSPLPKGVSIEA